MNRLNLAQRFETRAAAAFLFRGLFERLRGPVLKKQPACPLPRKPAFVAAAYNFTRQMIEAFAMTPLFITASNLHLLLKFNADHASTLPGNAALIFPTHSRNFNCELIADPRGICDLKAGAVG